MRGQFSVLSARHFESFATKSEVIFLSPARAFSWLHIFFTCCQDRMRLRIDCRKALARQEWRRAEGQDSLFSLEGSTGKSLCPAAPYLALPRQGWHRSIQQIFLDEVHFQSISIPIWLWKVVLSLLTSYSIACVSLEVVSCYGCCTG